VVRVDDRGFVVICCMSLHVFNHQQKAVNEFHRVLRGGGTVAVSVNTTPENSLTGYIRILLAKYVPERREEIEAWRRHQFRLGEARSLRRTLETAGFKDVETFTETRQIEYPYLL
jgi:ubiquinone/menaquinone biosynthesis C-methylase UbiE